MYIYCKYILNLHSIYYENLFYIQECVCGKYIFSIKHILACKTNFHSFIIITISYLTRLKKELLESLDIGNNCLYNTAWITAPNIFNALLEKNLLYCLQIYAKYVIYQSNDTVDKGRMMCFS